TPSLRKRLSRFLIPWASDDEKAADVASAEDNSDPKEPLQTEASTEEDEAMLEDHADENEATFENQGEDNIAAPDKHAEDDETTPATAANDENSQITLVVSSQDAAAEDEDSPKHNEGLKKASDTLVQEQEPRPSLESINSMASNQELDAATQPRRSTRRSKKPIATQPATRRSTRLRERDHSVSSEEGDRERQSSSPEPEATPIEESKEQGKESDVEASQESATTPQPKARRGRSQTKRGTSAELQVLELESASEHPVEMSPPLSDTTRSSVAEEVETVEISITTFSETFLGAAEEEEEENNERAYEDEDDDLTFHSTVESQLGESRHDDDEISQDETADVEEAKYYTTDEESDAEKFYPSATPDDAESPVGDQVAQDKAEDNIAVDDTEEEQEASMENDEETAQETKAEVEIQIQPTEPQDNVQSEDRLDTEVEVEKALESSPSPPAAESISESVLGTEAFEFSPMQSRQHTPAIEGASQPSKADKAIDDAGPVPATRKEALDAFLALKSPGALSNHELDNIRLLARFFECMIGRYLTPYQAKTCCELIEEVTRPLPAPKTQDQSVQHTPPQVVKFVQPARVIHDSVGDSYHEREEAILKSWEEHPIEEHLELKKYKDVEFDDLPNYLKARRIMYWGGPEPRELRNLRETERRRKAKKANDKKFGRLPYPRKESVPLKHAMSTDDEEEEEDMTLERHKVAKLDHASDAPSSAVSTPAPAVAEKAAEESQPVSQVAKRLMSIVDSVVDDESPSLTKSKGAESPQPRAPAAPQEMASAFGPSKVESAPKFTFSTPLPTEPTSSIFAKVAAPQDDSITSIFDPTTPSFNFAAPASILPNNLIKGPPLSAAAIPAMGLAALAASSKLQAGSSPSQTSALSPQESGDTDDAADQDEIILDSQDEQSEDYQDEDEDGFYQEGEDDGYTQEEDNVDSLGENDTGSQDGHGEDVYESEGSYNTDNGPRGFFSAAGRRRFDEDDELDATEGSSQPSVSVSVSEDVNDDEGSEDYPQEEEGEDRRDLSKFRISPPVYQQSVGGWDEEYGIVSPMPSPKLSDF
ncbi:hypothetical protein BGW38_004822, partial [Lunasporangiospora selenospora]